MTLIVVRDCVLLAQTTSGAEKCLAAKNCTRSYIYSYFLYINLILYKFVPMLNLKPWSAFAPTPTSEVAP